MTRALSLLLLFIATALLLTSGCAKPKSAAPATEAMEPAPARESTPEGAKDAPAMEAADKEEEESISEEKETASDELSGDEEAGGAANDLPPPSPEPDAIAPTREQGSESVQPEPSRSKRAAPKSGIKKSSSKKQCPPTDEDCEEEDGDNLRKRPSRIPN